MKRTWLVMLALLFAVHCLAKDSIWFNGSFKSAMARAEKEGKLILIEFYSDG